MLSTLALTLALAASPLQSAPQTPQSTSTLPPVETVTEQAEPETRRVCRFETVTGSNRRTRVCRDVSRHQVQDQTTRDFMRDSQRVRMPDGG